MTKDAYYEMCESMDIEPTEEDIPLELQDFPDLVQNVIIIYSKLTDTWDTMGGKFLGKDYSLVFDLFKLYGISRRDEKLLSMDLLAVIDNTRMKVINDKVVAASKTKKSR